jgi:hypothetical protein
VTDIAPDGENGGRRDDAERQARSGGAIPIGRFGFLPETTRKCNRDMRAISTRILRGFGLKPVLNEPPLANRIGSFSPPAISNASLKGRRAVRLKRAACAAGLGRVLVKPTDKVGGGRDNRQARTRA